MSRLAFHRPARFLPPRLPDEKIELPNPPEVQGRQAGALIATLLPLLTTVGMAGYMITFGRPVLIVVGMLFVVVAIGTTITMRIQMRNASQKGNRRQSLRYRSLLAGARDSARQVARAQRQNSALIHPDPDRLWAISSTYQRVWERRSDDPDFLRVRVGTGDADLVTPIQIGSRLDPLADYDWELLRAAQRLVNRMGTIDGQPAVVDLAGCGVVSLLGPAELTAALARAMICQVAVLHAPDDVRIAVERSGSGDWDWVKWLPHVIEEDAHGPAGVAPLVAARPEDLAEYLERELLRRQELAVLRRGQLSVGRGAGAPLTRLIVVFTGFEPVSDWGRSALLRSLLEAAGPRLGITLVFLVERESDEPGRADLRLRLGEGGELAMEGESGLVAAEVRRCVPDLVQTGLAELIARRLAPLRLTDEREKVLTRTISLTEMLLGGDPLTVDITGRWADTAGEDLLRVTIGSDGDGEPVVLDIKEPAQGGFGPHGLIVGATGSGKSELLRTLVTGLSLTHPPEALSFVLIDFKGGAAFAPLTDLPHVAGLITNLADDAAMIDRAQAALVGEQQRRQRMLRAAGNLDSIRDYQRRQAAGAVGLDGEPLEPLPYLLIIVDEFSELLSGRPELADLFVQIGRVGRSLGLHLLLATQRLEEGRLRGLDSHLSYRICLRTFSPGESRTVIGTADAYQLPPIPGSAYLKVDESIYRRFRVAHVSSPYISASDQAEAARVPGPSIVPFDAAWPAPDASARPGPARVEDTAPTELAVVVGRLKTVGRPVHQVWLPPLPPAISLDYLTGAPSVRPHRGLAVPMWPRPGNLKIPIGVLDLPVLQQQQPLIMDFSGSHGHLAVVGAPQTGRSTALRTVMMAGMLTHTPEEMQFYCIDFGGGSLQQYASAPHVGSVAARTDAAMVRRALAEVRSLIADREVLFRELGLDSAGEFRARRSAGLLPEGTQAADVFLVIDNWGGLRGEFEDADAAVTDIAGRGLGVGVHLVITASRWMEIRPALRDSIGTRMELRLNNPTESEVNRRLATQLPNGIPGRGIEAPGAYFHLALPRLDGQETADGVREAQDDVLAKIAAGWSGTAAPPVRMLPSFLSTERLRELPRGTTPGVPIGIAETDLSLVTLDLAGGDPHFLVFGDSGSGKTSLLRTFIDGLTATSSAREARVVLVDYRRSLLGSVPEDYLGAYAPDVTAVQVYVEQVCAALAERLPPPRITRQELAARGWWEGPDIYFVVDDYDLVGGQPLAPLAEYLPHARDIGLRVVLARRVSGLGRGFGDGFFHLIKELGCGGLVLSGDHREGPVLGGERAAARPPGRGVLVRRGRPGELIQVAHYDESAGAAAASAHQSANWQQHPTGVPLPG
jgi:S-DNA-T family DNA segregation ATPase FtsK/SpoIIIE